MSTTSQSLNLRGVISEAKRIINAHARHFLALSVLFLLPLSFSIIIYPTLQFTLSQTNSIFHHHRPHAHLFFSFYTSPHLTTSPDSTTLLPILYTIFATVISLCAFATITYSTVQGFYGRPVKIISSLKSLLFSIIPLCSTYVVAELIVCLIGATFGVFGVLIYKGLESVGVDVSYDSKYFTWFGILVLLIVAVCVIYLQVNWVLACVIVVVEAKWGYEPLRRSAYLIKGMRGVAFSLLMLYGILIGLICWGGSRAVAVDANGVWGWKSWALIFETVFYSGLGTMLMLQNVAATAVLYMYCKAVHGELALEIVEEFARDYVSLPFDDEKVPHVVSVVQG